MWVKIIASVALMSASVIDLKAQRNTDIPLGPAVPLPSPSAKPPAASAPATKQSTGSTRGRDSQGDPSTETAAGAKKGAGSSGK